MKKWLPHFVYIGLLLAGSLYFQSSLNRENRLIQFLNRPTDEAYEETMQANRTLADEIGRTEEAYPNDRNILISKAIAITDSLVTAALARPDERDSLAGHLWGLTGKEPVIESFFRRPDPGTAKAFARSSYRKTYLQNDSLRTQIMCLEVLKHFQQQTSRSAIICFGTEPVISFTTLCPRAGEPFRADFLLNDIRLQQWVGDLAVRVNDQPVRVDDGLAYYEHTFPDTGLYPLRVRMDFRQWGRDSFQNVEKTFFVRVNR